MEDLVVGDFPWCNDAHDLLDHTDDGNASHSETRDRLVPVLLHYLPDCRGHPFGCDPTQDLASCITQEALAFFRVIFVPKVARWVVILSIIPPIMHDRMVLDLVVVTLALDGARLRWSSGRGFALLPFPSPNLLGILR